MKDFNVNLKKKEKNYEDICRSRGKEISKFKGKISGISFKGTLLDGRPTTVKSFYDSYS